MSDLSIQRDMRRQLAEKAFEATMREYIIDKGRNMYGDGRKYRFGGAHNFLSTVHTIFEKLAVEFGCADYEQVAVAMQDVLNTCDLPFKHEEEESDDYPRDIAAELADRENDARRIES